MTHYIGVPTINKNGIHHIERKLALVDCTSLNSMDPKPLKTRILPHPFTKADKILYVLDGADRDRLKEGLDWLEKVVECLVPKIPCCLVMTKSDKANPITIEEVQELLSFRLDSVFQIIIRVNKNDRQGFNELFEWLQQ
ncbi:hypothetical protein FGO68_gene15572 [Halteria grandinella]|uniref:Uncharacterized protein n=1 Tax=Halteria grandinella TaxID=5974 RepID=A0A8J8T569_HALGN|nr:hypothetical protein FGO68_gene15572 [Halteria grandinella]